MRIRSFSSVNSISIVTLRYIGSLPKSSIMSSSASIIMLNGSVFVSRKLSRIAPNMRYAVR